VRDWRGESSARERGLAQQRVLGSVRSEGQCQAVTKRLIALHFCLNRKFKCPVKCKEGSKVPKWMKNVMVDDLADCKGKASSMAKDQVCKTVPSLQSQHKKMHPLPPPAVELG
jgi:hypothetical protein